MKNKKKLIFAALGVIAFALFAFVLRPPEALSAAAEARGSTGVCAMRIAGVLLLAVFWWIGAVLPDWGTAIVMLCLWVLLSGQPFKYVFQTFSGSTVWLFVGAFPLAAAVTKCGLLRRISLKLMKLFPMSFFGQVLASLTVGTICTPLIPSASAKGVLGANISRSTSDALGYASGSKARTGLFVASWVGFGVMSVAFVNASVTALVVRGTIPDQSQVTWLSWFVAMIPWLVIVFAGMLLALYFLFRPKKGEEGISRDELRKQLEDLPPMSRDEKFAAVILGACLIMWVLESVTGVEATIVALFGSLLCIAAGIISFEDFAKAVPWTMIVFSGTVMVIGNMFSAGGINDYLQVILGPVFDSLKNPVLLIIVIVLAANIVRLFIASLSAVAMIFMAILVPIVSAMGMSPFVTALIIFAAIQCWFTTYQNGVYLPAYHTAEDTIKQKYSAIGCAAYELISLAACLASIPYWRMLGYITM